MPEIERPRAREPAASPDLRVRAAWLYYVEGMTQEQIARFMNISRAKVIRLLASARDNGIVRIRIEDRASEQIALERRLVAAFGLADAIVVAGAGPPAQNTTHVAKSGEAFSNRWTLPASTNSTSAALQATRSPSFMKSAAPETTK